MYDSSILEKENCTGCGACYNICPANAITMQEDDEGFLYPVIDEEKCTNCGLCAKSCACLNPKYENNKNPECFAFMASDEERVKSSSGGVFPVLAKNFINNGGYVAGAVWDSDCGVEHIVSNKVEDIEKMRSSKYLQSNTKYCFKEIKLLLNDAKKVLFTGCPCQVAGLKAYLKKDYDNLFCVDLICHGVPSPKVFKKYIKEEVLKTEDEKWLNTNFRDKITGWNEYSITTTTTKNSITGPAKDDHFIKVFLKNLCLRRSCATCKFSTFPRQGDITMGDFWGISKFKKKYDDKKGTSVILINNKKGKHLSDILKNDSILYDSVPVEIAKNGNPCLISNSLNNKNRNLFFKEYSKRTLKELLKYCLTDNGDYFIVNYWDSAFNYGAMLTAYALQEIIAGYGFIPKLINTGEKTTELWYKNSWVEKFENEYLNTTSILTFKKAKLLSKTSKGVILGSDQVLRYKYMRKALKKFMLSWVDSNVPKYAIAPSFGHEKNEYLISEKLTKKQINFIKNNLKQFDFLSCRESSGIEIYKDIYGFDAEVLLDPVFLLSKESYVTIAQKSNIECSDKIGVYILEKNNIMYKNLRNNIETNYENKIFDINIHHHTVNDWLKLILECKLFVTDSFHGACFSMIFNKPFIYVENGVRGNSRFNNINESFDLQKFIYSEDKQIEEYLNNDFKETNNKLESEIAHCRHVLDTIFKDDSVHCPKKQNMNRINKYSLNYIKTYISYKRAGFLANHCSERKKKHYTGKRDSLKYKLDWELL